MNNCPCVASCAEPFWNCGNEHRKKTTQTARKLGRGDGVPLFWTRSFYLLILEVEDHYTTEISHSCTKTQKQLQLCARGSICHIMGGYYKHCDRVWILTLQHSSLARAKTQTQTHHLQQQMIQNWEHVLWEPRVASPCGVFMFILRQCAWGRRPEGGQCDW